MFIIGVYIQLYQNVFKRTSHIYCMEEKEERKVDKKHKKVHDKLRKNPWILSTIILGMVLLIVLFGNFNITGSVVSEKEAGGLVMGFVASQGAEGAELVKVIEQDELYEVTIEYQGQSLPLYVTKDGKNLVQGVIPLTTDSINEGEKEENSDSNQQEIPRSDKPEVELFTMTHCPGGTQAEKGFIPVMESLEGLVDSEIRFVHYFMHEPEETETPRQVCIREEQSDKYLDYLKCFLEDGDSSRCIEEIGINSDSLNTCLEEKADEYYAGDSELSEGYGVRGSPTLIINGKQVSPSSRSPEAYLDIICQAFTEDNVPEECETLELGSSSYSPGFGYETSGTTT